MTAVSHVLYPLQMYPMTDVWPGLIGPRNNTYKSIRLYGEGYNLYYSTWCSNEHELYNLNVCDTIVEHVSGDTKLLSNLIIYRTTLDNSITFYLRKMAPNQPKSLFYYWAIQLPKSSPDSTRCCLCLSRARVRFV